MTKHPKPNRVRLWLLDTLERAVTTFAEATLAVLPASYLPGVAIPWWAAFATGGFAALAAVLKCLAALKVGDPNTASLLPEATP